MNKKEMKMKCDYDLIFTYQNGTCQEKKDVEEVMYMRYQGLMYKVGMKYCQYTGISNLEDFQQEAYFELVRVLNSIQLNRVSPDWKIVKVYKQRLKNMMHLMTKREIKQTNHICHYYTSEHGRKNIKVEISSYNPPKTDKDSQYEYQIDYIQNFCKDDQTSFSIEKSQQVNQLYYFIEEYLDLKNNNNENDEEEIDKFDYIWFKEVLKLIIFSGIKKIDACKVVGITPQRFYQVINKQKKYSTSRKSLRKKWEEFLEKSDKILY